MPVSLGDRLGPYEILACLGKGGMGEVYSARDTRLDRDVAIKVSQERFTERFEREARTIAALNHPNVCHLYDVDPNYLVMELVEGPTLAERLKQGAIPLDEALNIARQIADALEAAHEKGIVHRDLKPGNIKIRPDGAVKVLDFGLAKMGGTPAVQGEHSPTQTVGPTEAGMILGTAGYMSPEQARGKPVDQRADIYAFGVVLYEMLAGERLHHGETTTEVLASVIKEDPQWDKVPPQVRRLLRRCLEKDPQRRLRHIGDVMALVDDAPVAPIAVAALPTTGNRWLWPVVAAVALLIAGVFAFLYLRPKAAPAASVQRFEIAPPEQLGNRALVVSVSPDGTRVVFSGPTFAGANRLWVRRLDSVQSQPLDGTDGAAGFLFWSPDSRFIVFGTVPEGKLKKIEASGGPAQILADAGEVYGGFWTADGRIVFSASKDVGGYPALWEIPAAGGTASILPGVEHAADEGTIASVLLPDGRHFIYSRSGPSAPASQSGTYLGSLDAKPGQNAKKLLPDASDIVYAPSPEPERGYLLFVRAGSTAPNGVSGTLMAQPFDLRKLDLAGEPVPIAEGVLADGFSASQTGVLAYRAGLAGPGSWLTWFDRQGKTLGTAGDPGDYQSIAISPDGTRVAASRADSPSGEDLWMLDLARAVSTRFTFNRGLNMYPVWSPDASRIVFTSARNVTADLYEKLSNGGGDDELLFKSDKSKVPIGWSPDGRFLMFGSTTGGFQSWVLPLDSQGRAAGKPYLFLTGGIAGKFSPDMRWIAYSSNESGKFEVYVRPFDPNSANGSPSGGGKWQVSTGGGGAPRWNGKELFYLAADGVTVMVVDVTPGPAFQPGTPRALFKANGLARTAAGAPWDVSPDGKKFLFPIPAAANTAAPFNIVLNWTSLLKK
jgi:Tol biopolymer transport system component/predicted Ser/Thr protein kinase